MFVIKISISDRNWFRKLLGLERLKTFIKRNNSYISKTFWQKIGFICFYPSVPPHSIPRVLPAHTLTILRWLLEF